MASEEVDLVPTTQGINSLNPQLLFQEQNPLRFNRAVGDPGLGPKTRELGGFMDDKTFAVDHRDRYFSPEYRRSGGGVFGEGTGPHRRSWNGGGSGSPPSSGEDEDDDDDEVEDDEDDGDEDDNGEVGGLVGIDDNSGVRKDSNNSSDGGGGVSGSVGDKVGVGSDKNHATFGSPSRQVVVKDGSLLQAGGDANRGSSSENGQQQGRVGQFQKMVTIAEHDGEMYYSQLLQGTEGSSHGHKDISGDNGCGFSGRKEGSVFSDPGESLRAILSDPITGALMDDAMILPCGHSFGRGGIQQVIKMKACYTCSRPVSEDSVAPNLSLRVAIQAFLREEDMQYKASKRRRERFEQEKGNYSDSPFIDTPRARGVQFPFAVTDRVMIKGNKRTPQRFVGREAVVTTQCLNGWYVVKTLDNAESVKLQYRSLEKVSDNPSSKPTLDKLTPNWL